MHHDDVVCGEVHSFVRAGNRGIIPFRNLAQEYTCDSVLGEIEFCSHAGNVVSRYVSAEDRWEMQNPKAVLILESLELIVVHGAIGGAEIHGAFGDLLNAAAGADRLIVNLKIGVLLVVFVKPLGIHGVRKCCARTVDRERAFRPQNASDGKNYQEHSCNSLHSSSPSESIVFSRECQVCAPIVTALLQRLHCCLNRGPLGPATGAKAHPMKGLEKCEERPRHRKEGPTSVPRWYKRGPFGSSDIGIWHRCRRCRPAIVVAGL